MKKLIFLITILLLLFISCDWQSQEISTVGDDKIVMFKIIDHDRLSKITNLDVISWDHDAGLFSVNWTVKNESDFHTPAKTRGCSWPLSYQCVQVESFFKCLSNGEEIFCGFFERCVRYVCGPA